MKVCRCPWHAYRLSKDGLTVIGWWSGTNATGQAGLFPSNYCELVEAEEEEAAAPPPPPPAPPAPPAPAPPPGAAVAAREAEEEEDEGEVMIAAYE